LVLDYLKKQEGVHGVQRLAALGQNFHPSTGRRFLKLITNLAVEFDHSGHARRSRIVNEHRGIEIAFGKHRGDV